MIDGYSAKQRSSSSTLGVMAVMTLLFVLAASPATAQGFNLSWDDCGLFGPQTKTFACNSDVGAPFVMSGSFYAPVDIEHFVGVLVEIGLRSDGPFSDWWRFGYPPCRSGVSLQLQGPNTLSCANPYGGPITTAFSYDSDPTYGGCLTLTVSTDPGAATALVPGEQYEAFRVLVPRTGTSSCSPACQRQTCIQINSFRLLQSSGAGDVDVTNPGDRGFVYWQSAVIGCPTTGGPSPIGSCDRPTSPQRSSWGMIRQLYR